jgi:hypothetical protein
MVCPVLRLKSAGPLALNAIVSVSSNAGMKKKKIYEKNNIKKLSIEVIQINDLLSFKMQNTQCMHVYVIVIEIKY